MIELKGPWAAKATEPANLYLDLLARLLYGGLYEQVLYPVAATPRGRKHRVFEPIRRLLASRGLVLARSMRIVPERFATSPPPRIPVAETMVGPRGLQNIRECVDNVLDDGVPGDLIEAGVWRGGATVFMRALCRRVSTNRISSGVRGGRSTGRNIAPLHAPRPALVSASALERRILGVTELESVERPVGRSCL
jgi:hypothetical protein